MSLRVRSMRSNATPRPRSPSSIVGKMGAMETEYKIATRAARPHKGRRRHARASRGGAWAALSVMSVM